MNFYSLAVDNINKYGEYVYLTFQGQEYTNVEMGRISNQLAHGWYSQGLKEGDRVMVFMPNAPEILISYGAILRAGATVVPVNPALSSQELSYIIDHSEPFIIITSPALLETVRKAKGIASTQPLVIVTGTERLGEDTLSFSECYAANDDFLLVDRADDDTAVIIYTSGTTGTPKGVMISHANLYTKSHGDSESVGLIDANGNLLMDVIQCVVLPFSHVYGLMTMGCSWVAGGKIHLMPGFDLEQIFRCIDENKITFFGGVPTMFAWMAVFPNAEKYDTSSVVRWVSGGAPLSPEVRKAFETKFNGKIMEGYGLTESVSGNTQQRYDRPTKPGSVGSATPGSEIRIISEEGQPLPAGQIGEICIKGPYVMKGYYKNEEETARVIKDGWLHTGDVGYIDEDGEVFIVDRIKDMIIRGGFNIYPNEVEKVLCTHPGILDAGVLGVPDGAYGEQVCAFIVPTAGAEISKADILSFCRENLAKYKVPRYIEFCEVIPRNPLGKALRREMRVQASSIDLVAVE